MIFIEKVFIDGYCFIINKKGYEAWNSSLSKLFGEARLRGVSLDDFKEITEIDTTIKKIHMTNFTENVDISIKNSISPLKIINAYFRMAKYLSTSFSFEIEYSEHS